MVAVVDTVAEVAGGMEAAEATGGGAEGLAAGGRPGVGGGADPAVHQEGLEGDRVSVAEAGGDSKLSSHLLHCTIIHRFVPYSRLAEYSSVDLW